MITDDKLNKCPACGSKDIFKLEFRDKLGFYIRCNNCGAITGHAKPDPIGLKRRRE